MFWGDNAAATPTSLVDSLPVTISWIVTGRQENTKFLPAAALFTGKQFVSSDV